MPRLFPVAIIAAMITNYENSHYVPLYCDLRDKKVVIVGGGRVAERKVRSLSSSGALITLISPKITQGLSTVVQQGRLEYIKRSFQEGDLEGAWLVIAATDDEQVQERVFQEAQRQRCFCNVVDQPEKCSFIVPSLVKRGALSIAISTGGQSPALARSLRIRLQEQFGEEWAIYVELIGRLRRMILTQLPESQRSQRLEKLIHWPCLDWIREKKWEKVIKWAIDICGQDAHKIVKDVIS